MLIQFLCTDTHSEQGAVGRCWAVAQRWDYDVWPRLEELTV